CLIVYCENSAQQQVPLQSRLSPHRLHRVSNNFPDETQAVLIKKSACIFIWTGYIVNALPASDDVNTKVCNYKAVYACVLVARRCNPEGLLTSHHVSFCGDRQNGDETSPFGVYAAIANYSASNKNTVGFL